MRFMPLVLIISLCLTFYGCASFFPQQGPSRAEILTAAVEHKSEEISKFITVVELNPVTVQKIKREHQVFPSEFFTKEFEPRLGVGDVVEIVIHEQPPSVLFSLSDRLTQFSTGPQVIGIDGTVEIPFIGKVIAVKKTSQQLASEIKDLLRGKANNPTVYVRQHSFDSSYVTVLGNVRESRKIPLSYNVSTVLDVLAHAGGVTSPVDKTVIQIDRAGRRITLPLDDILSKPELNINLLPRDRVTVLFKNQSVTVLGATGKNQEIEFEAKGINLSQLIARAGGLNPNLANAQGVFIFRFEDKEVAKILDIKNPPPSKEGVPLIYNLDLTKPESFFTAKNFMVKDGDIVYVATAPVIQYQQFLSILSNTISPVFMLERMTRD